MKNNEKILQQLKGTKIFCGLDGASLQSVVDSSTAVRFAKGTVIYSKTEFSKCLGLILRGSAIVSKESGAHTLVLSRLQEGDLFGAVTLFAGYDYFVNQITAAAQCEVLFIEKKAVAMLMEKDVSFAQNYIAYLSERIYFLNQKIESFTAGSAESRLANYLINCSNGEDAFFLTTNLTALSKALDIGRSSLYRAFDELESRGLIKRAGKEIMISDRKNLIRYVE